MAYLSQIDNGICPPSHPILLPVLFIEVPYDVNTITKDGGKFVFANGDETGYGFHGQYPSYINTHIATNKGGRRLHQW